MELLYRTYDVLRQSIEAYLLDRVQSPAYRREDFERLVVELLGAMGYGSSTDETRLKVTKLSGDEGIDGIIREALIGQAPLALRPSHRAASEEPDMPEGPARPWLWFTEARPPTMELRPGARLRG